MTAHRQRLPRPRYSRRPSPGQMQLVLLTLIRSDAPPLQVLAGGRRDPQPVVEMRARRAA